MKFSSYSRYAEVPPQYLKCSRTTYPPVATVKNQGIVNC